MLELEKILVIVQFSGFQTLFFKSPSPFVKRILYRIECVKHSAAMIEENSVVEISPVPPYILPHPPTQQMSIKPSWVGPKPGFLEP